MEGTHPLAGRYHGKEEFIQATFERLGLLIVRRRAFEAGSPVPGRRQAIAELLSRATTAEGAPFDNRYCWVCRFEGNTIVQVRAYLDSGVVAYTVLRND